MTSMPSLAAIASIWQLDLKEAFKLGRIWLEEHSEASRKAMPSFLDTQQPGKPIVEKKLVVGKSGNLVNSFPFAASQIAMASILWRRRYGSANNRVVQWLYFISCTQTVWRCTVYQKNGEESCVSIVALSTWSLFTNFTPPLYLLNDHDNSTYISFLKTAAPCTYCN